MTDFFLEFEDFALELFWYFLDAFELLADEIIAFCLVFASLIEDLVQFYFIRIKILA